MQLSRFSETCSSADSSFSLTSTLSDRCTLPSRKARQSFPVGGQFVSVLVMIPMLPAQWHGVQATTRHKQRPPTIRLHRELNQVFATIDNATLFLEKIHTQHQRSRFRLIHEQVRRIQKSPRASFQTGSLHREVAFDKAPSPKLNDRPPNGSTPGKRISCS